MNEKAIYFPGLNGLRAIAALSVVISHITLALADYHLDPHIFGDMKDGNPIGIYLGNYGVSIFFTLSGFLITYLLEAEKERQPIDIKKFYIRRILRIWPLYYAYLGLAVLTIFLFKLYFNTGTFFLYFFYCANIPYILAIMLPFLNHYWSLGVEEQFYLFWPWIMKKVKNNLIIIIMSMICILIGTKLIAYIISPHSILANALMVTRFHCMMIGGLGAILYKQHNGLLLRIAEHKFVQIISWLVIFLSAVNIFHIASIIDNEIISLLSVFIIIGQININARIVNLENKVFDFLGKISYGIYVIHPLVIFYLSKVMGDLSGGILKYILVYVCVTAATILVAYISFEYFEKYFLTLKKKYMVVKSKAANV